ncbi:MAG: ester cyclase, partial [Amnibacterium sp.]
MTSVEELARASLEHFNSGDLDALRAEMGPGFVYEETGTGRRVTDPDEAIAGFRQWRTALPDVTGTITRLVVDGDLVAMEIRWRGTHTGPLATPGGEVPPTGRRIEVWATFWQEWRDGRIVAERHHLDLLS